MYVYVWEHIVSLYYRTTEWMFMKLGRDEVLMALHMHKDVLPHLPKGGSRARQNRSPGRGGVSPLLSPRNALRWGYSNAAVVPSVRPSVCGSVRPCVDLVNTTETIPLHVSLSNLADMLTMMRG